MWGSPSKVNNFFGSLYTPSAALSASKSMLPQGPATSPGTYGPMASNYQTGTLSNEMGLGYLGNEPRQPKPKKSWTDMFRRPS